MSILTSLLPGILDTVIEKITNQLPVTENEKENIKVQAEKELANHAGAIAEAEATISTNAKDAWLGELHNGGFLATTWRPLLAVTATFIVFWDGVLLSIINAILNSFEAITLSPTPAWTIEVSMWVLLTLIGARGVEKLGVVKAQSKK